jgi:hypothetical protein
MSRIATFVSTFTGTAAIWWLYFDAGAELGVARITHFRDPGDLGRSAYTYLHVPIIVGIVLDAIADEFVIAHAGTSATSATCLSVVGGPLAYLIAIVLFKRVTEVTGAPWHPTKVAVFIVYSSCPRHDRGQRRAIEAGRTKVYRRVRTPAVRRHAAMSAGVRFENGGMRASFCRGATKRR